MEGFQPFELKGKREGCPSFNNLGNLSRKEWHSRGRGFDSHQLHSPFFSREKKGESKEKRVGFRPGGLKREQ